MPLLHIHQAFIFGQGVSIDIKRCEESKRTLKNPFASRLAEFMQYYTKTSQDYRSMIYCSR